jgi:hypothetical protein
MGSAAVGGAAGGNPSTLGADTELNFEAGIGRALLPSPHLNIVEGDASARPNRSAVP